MADDGEIFEFLSSYAGTVQDLVWRVRDIVQETLPDASEGASDGRAG